MMEIIEYGQFRDGGSESILFSNGLRVYVNRRIGDPNQNKVYDDTTNERTEIIDSDLVRQIAEAITLYRKSL